jgi:hypothetical protein
MHAKTGQGADTRSSQVKTAPDQPAILGMEFSPSILKGSPVYDNIWNALDEEIARLRQARALLEGAATGPIRKTAKKTSARAISEPAPRRTLSAKARHAIAEAQRKRWAKVKAQKSAATQESAPRSVKT